MRVGHASRSSHATPFHQPRAQMNPDHPVRRVRRALWNPDLADLVLRHLVKAGTLSVTHATPFHQPRAQMNPDHLVCTLRLCRAKLRLGTIPGNRSARTHTCWRSWRGS